MNTFELLDDLDEVYSVAGESMACNGCMEGMSQRRILGTDVPFVCLSQGESSI
jgi:hypothetical protein